MKIEVKSVDILKGGSEGKRLAVNGNMRIDILKNEYLKLVTSDSETVGGDESGFPPANNIYERHGGVVICRSEIGHIVEKAVSEGLLDLDNKMAL